jgi:tight adherence protein B
VGLSAAQWGAGVVDRLNARVLARLRPVVEGVGGPVEKLPVLLRWWRAATVVVLFVFWAWVAMPPVAIFLAFVVNRTGPILVEWWAANRRKKLNEQAATASRCLAGQVRVGMPLVEALAAVAKETPNPFGMALRRAVGRLDAGEGIRDVLTDLKARVRVDAVGLMSTALLVAAERGGKLADVLGRISHTLEELQRVTRKRDTDTAAGRLMVLIMAVFPAAFVGLFSVLDPVMMKEMFDTLAGQLVLATVGGLIYVSTRWAGRILAKVE